ncbi:MAG TPA: hypothetical protein VMW70_15445 [Burkholderiales bacterium]|nr:hypothetical protein [Burkholderiales bacterium]
MLDHTQPTAALNRLSRFFLLETLYDARELLDRYRHVESFNNYISERMFIIVPALLLQFLTGIGCVMGIVTLLPDMHWALILPILLSMPVILAGSVFVQIYVFFCWIEGRSMERALGAHRKARRGAFATWMQSKLHLDIGPPPRVPWVLAALFVLAPLLSLAHAWLPAAAVFIGLAIVMPFIYASVDR